MTREIAAGSGAAVAAPAPLRPGAPPAADSEMPDSARGIGARQ